MNYNIKGTNLEITDEIRIYVEKCLAHSEKFLQGDTSAHADVECQLLTSTQGKPYRAEFTATASQAMYRAEASGDTLHEALDIAAAELAKELRRNKKMKLKVFRHSAVKVKEFLRGWRTKI